MIEEFLEKKLEMGQSPEELGLGMPDRKHARDDAYEDEDDPRRRVRTRRDMKRELIKDLKRLGFDNSQVNLILNIFILENNPVSTLDDNDILIEEMNEILEKGIAHGYIVDLLTGVNSFYVARYLICGLNRFLDEAHIERYKIDGIKVKFVERKNKVLNICETKNLEQDAVGVLLDKFEESYSDEFNGRKELRLLSSLPGDIINILSYWAIWSHTGAENPDSGVGDIERVFSTFAQEPPSPSLLGFVQEFYHLGISKELFKEFLDCYSPWGEEYQPNCYFTLPNLRRLLTNFNWRTELSASVETQPSVANPTFDLPLSRIGFFSAAPGPASAPGSGLAAPALTPDPTAPISFREQMNPPRLRERLVPKFLIASSPAPK